MAYDTNAAFMVNKIKYTYYFKFITFLTRLL